MDFFAKNEVSLKNKFFKRGVLPFCAKSEAQIRHCRNGQNIPVAAKGIVIFMGVKLVAVGNRLMKDDAVGIMTAEALKDVLEDLKIETVLGETDVNYTFDLLDENDFIIFLDAVVSGGKPGDIHVYKLKEAVSHYTFNPSQHDMNIFDYMLRYGRFFNGYIIGIEAADISIGDKLSEELFLHFFEIRNKVFELVRNLSKEA